MPWRAPWQSNQKVLLLDEPFGALDTQVRKELHAGWLRRLHDEMHIASVFVTHDQEEALEVADRVVVMNKGHIEQVGTPDEVYTAPATPFVYRFLGNVNVFHTRLRGSWAEVDRAESDARDAVRPDTLAFVRPHDIEILKQAAEHALSGRVLHVQAIGPLVRVEIEHQHEIFEVELTRERHT